MEQQFQRSELLLGEDTLQLLKNKKVAIFGLGGVGGYALEMLCRLGIEKFTLIDADTFSTSNLNRQILATVDTIGCSKCEVAKNRILSINPNCKVDTYPIFYLPNNKTEIPFDTFDYIIDCIDTITSKVDLIITANEMNIPIVSAMGCGNRLDPTKLIITDLFSTQNDPLCRVMRHELKKRNITKLKVVYSTEPALKPLKQIPNERRKDIPGSVCFVPSTCGILLAYEVFRDLTNLKK